tara:strand:+ start:14859 stop:15467 length:609 start_codon:yes stop_codon:yes gene_type:complete
MQLFIVLFSSIILSACSLQPALEQVKQRVAVEISSGVFVSLPKPAQLKQVLNVSQLITAHWNNEGKEQRQQKLLVQLQVDQEQVVLAGFSSWGARILSLNYSAEQINTYVMTGLADTLPKPEQVLFNVMLSIWPVEAWIIPLQQIGWQLKETALQRLLIDDQGQVIVEINYQKKPYLTGLISFKHLMLNYQVDIETNLSGAL